MLRPAARSRQTATLGFAVPGSSHKLQKEAYVERANVGLHTGVDTRKGVSQPKPMQTQNANEDKQRQENHNANAVRRIYI